MNHQRPINVDHIERHIRRVGNKQEQDKTFEPPPITVKIVNGLSHFQIVGRTLGKW